MSLLISEEERRAQFEADIAELDRDDPDFLFKVYMEGSIRNARWTLGEEAYQMACENMRRQA